MTFRLPIATFLVLCVIAATDHRTVSGSQGGAQHTVPPTFSSRSDLVVLNVAVTDRRGAYVDGLTAEAFTVNEDGRQQQVRLFAAEEAPVTAGLLVDASASMESSRSLVIAAAGTFVDAHKPGDEIFALTFNERVRSALDADAPFTDNSAMLRIALWRSFSRPGRTALYDAILTGLTYLERGSHQRHALVIVADGGDNASTATFEQALRRAQSSNAVIYAIVFRDPLDRDANPGRLRRLARESGGEAFEPRGRDNISDVVTQIASAIRQSYTIGFVPVDAVADGRLRRIRVSVRAPGHGDLRVRTRSAYVIEER
jgi:Ca-activated chloride channel family protein